MTWQAVLDGCWRWQQWALGDEMGQRAALGVALLLMLASAMMGRRVIRRMLARCRRLPQLMVLTAGGYYAAVWGLRLAPEQWGLAAAVAGMVLVLLALANASAQRSRRTRRGGVVHA